MIMNSKFFNPNAKIANIVLAIVYIVVISALFVGAMMYQFSL